MHVICCYRVFGSAFLRRDAESEDARKMPDREEKAGKKQGYEKNLKKVLTYIRRFARLFNALTYSANIRHGEVSKWS